MPTRVEEKHPLGEEIGRKAAAATGPDCITFLLKVVSAINQRGRLLMIPQRDLD